MKSIREREAEADKVIQRWTAGGLIGNLAPPPFDSIAVVSAMAKMGYDILNIYGEIDFSEEEIYQLAKIIFKAMRSVSFAACVGTSLLKYIPEVGIWVALFIQPPIVAAMTYTTGQSFKKYYSTYFSTGKRPEESVIVKFAKELFAKKLAEAKKQIWIKRTHNKK